MNHFDIKAGYKTRMDNSYFDDTPFEDEFQRPVYEHARAVLHRLGLRKVVDVGCGSGFKLLKFFSEYEAVGVDLPPTVAWLRQRYPMGHWVENGAPNPHGQIVICSDVIEHLPNPDDLLDYIDACQPEVVVLSTPARELLPFKDTQDGPPRNVHHVREWTMAELKTYIGRRWNVAHQFSTEVATQVVECYPRR